MANLRRVVSQLNIPADLSRQYFTNIKIYNLRSHLNMFQFITKNC